MRGLQIIEVPAALPYEGLVIVQAAAYGLRQNEPMQGAAC